MLRHACEHHRPPAGQSRRPRGAIEIARVAVAVALAIACAPERSTAPTRDTGTPADSAGRSESVASVEVTRLFPSLFVGDTTRLFATARNADGVELRGLPVAWLSDQPDVALVDDGIVTALGPGASQIRAIVAGVAGTATVIALTPRIRPNRGIAYRGDSVNRLGIGPYSYAALTDIDAPPRRIISHRRSVIDRFLWAPHGESILINYPDIAHDGYFLTAPDGSEEREFGTNLHHVQWSPDGSRVVYARGTVPGNGFDLHVRNADGSGERLLVSVPGDETHPQWSPDGRQILFSKIGIQPGPLWVMAADGSSWRTIPLGHTASGAMGARWSPDGKRIAYGDGVRIFVANADGGEPRAILGTCLPWPWSCENQTTFIAPSWSPDGRLIAFNASVNGVARVGVATPDGAELRYVSPAACCSLNLHMPQQPPAWSPDGRWLAYEARTEHWLTIAVVRPDGTGLRAVTGAESAQLPAWRP